jgi:phospholipid-binding lipoprotein MlaA
MRRLKYKHELLRAFVVSWALCASVSAVQAEEDFLSEEELYGDFEEERMVVRDPLESVNRVTFKFNDFVYTHVLRHVANGYTAITPDPVERGATNFFDNLLYPIRLTGNLLQGRFKGAWVETERFVVNTTLGVVGVGRAADRFERTQPIAPEDVGQAFGAWGIGEGPYLVLPILGPSNCRDLVGHVGDRAVNPLRKPFSLIDEARWQLAFDASEAVVRSPSLMDLYFQMKDGAFDPYSSMKNVYSQKRRSMVQE